MDKLLDINNNVLSIGILDFIPSLKGHRIQRNLLDGTVHVQTIGEGRKEVSFVFYGYVTNCVTVNDLYFEGVKVKLHFDDTLYIGVLVTPPEWQETVNGDKSIRILESPFTMTVEEESLI
jgi:hypothetical protein